MNNPMAIRMNFIITFDAVPAMSASRRVSRRPLLYTYSTRLSGAKSCISRPVPKNTPASQKLTLRTQPRILSRVRVRVSS